MIVAAALCPSAPLLAPELTGSADVVPDLRQACAAAVASVLATEPSLMVVIGAAASTSGWPADSRPDFARFAPQSRTGTGGTGSTGSTGSTGGTISTGGLPLALGLGALILDGTGFRGPRRLQSVALDGSASECADLGAQLADSSDRIGLLLMADGSARRTRKAPGYFDERSAAFDAQVEQAVRAGRPAGLQAIDAALAADLMATGWPVWQVLAAAMRGRSWTAEVTYSGDPFGVFYLVAQLAAAAA